MVIKRRPTFHSSLLQCYPWRCPAVPTAVHTDYRHPVSTKTAVFFIRRSTRSCCQTAYYWTSRLLCLWHSHTERPTCRCQAQHRLFSPSENDCGTTFLG